MSDEKLEETLLQAQPEITQEEQPQHVQEGSESVPEAPPKEQIQNQQDPKESFRELREKASRIERERDELLARMQQQEKQKQAPEEDYDIGINDDDLAEGKHLKRQYKELRALKNEFEKTKQQIYEQTTEARLKSLYPDFDKVVNNETVTKLREIDPEIAATINSSGDLYNKAASAYKIIRKFGIYQDDTYAASRDAAAQNSAKPRPTNAISQGDSPMSRANAFEQGLTTDLKKKLWQEVLDAKKRM